MTKRIIEHIPVFTALIAIISITKLTLFYSNFSVSIKYFIGFSELATAVADDLLFVLLVYAGLKTIEFMFKDMKLNFYFFSSSENSQLVYRVIFILINIGVVVWSFLEKEYYLKILSSAYSYFFVFIALMETKFVRENIGNNKDFLFAARFFLLAMLGVVNITSLEIKSVTRGKYIGTTITTTDTTYISTDTCYYIGQTEKFIFLYSITNHCIVIPSSTIKKMDIYSN